MGRDDMTDRKPASWLLWGALLLIVLAQTQAALAKDLKDGPFVSAADVFAALLFGTWAFWALATGAWRHVTWPPLAAWALVAVALVSVGRADSPEALKSGIVDLAQYILYFVCVYLLFLNALRDEADIRRVVGLLAVLTAVMVVVAGVQLTMSLDPSASSESLKKISATFGIGDTLAQTPLGEKLHLAGKSSRSIYGNYLLMVLPLLFAMGFAEWRAKWVGPALHAIVAASMIVLTSGYHFWCLVAVLLALSLRRSPKAALAVAGLVVVFVLVSPFALKWNHQANIVEVMDLYETGVLDESAVVAEDFAGGELPTTTELKKRWIEWQPALNMLRENPVLGVGTGGYQLHIGGNYGLLPNFKKIEPDTNCGWLVVAGSMGLCGFIALVALLCSQYRSAAAQAASAASAYLRALSLGLAGSMAGLFLAMVISNVLVRGLSITVILMLALVSALDALPRVGEPPIEAPEPDATPTEPTQIPNGGLE